MNIYFYNSYQGSYTGFQLSSVDPVTKTLRSETKRALHTKESGLLLKSGARLCLMNIDGRVILSIRGLEGYNGISDNKWYINILLQFDEDLADLACNMLARYIASPDTFENEVAACFCEDREGEFSYLFDYSGFESLMSRFDENEILKSEFYGINDYEIKRFVNMLKNMRRHMNGSGVYLLVPEADKAYFIKQNPDFERVPVRYMFTSDAFDDLIKKNKSAFDLKMYKNAEKPSKTTEEDYDDLIMAAVITGGLLIGGLAVYGCIKLFSRDKYRR